MAKRYTKGAEITIIGEVSVKITNSGKYVEKRKPVCTADAIVYWCRHYSKQSISVPQKIKNRSSISTSGIYAKENKNTMLKVYAPP